MLPMANILCALLKLGNVFIKAVRTVTRKVQLNVIYKKSVSTFQEGYNVVYINEEQLWEARYPV